MRADRDLDWAKVLEERGRTPIQSRRPQLEELQRVAADLEYLTGDAHWDTLRSMVQAKLTVLRASRDTKREILENSDNFTTEDLINDKLAVRLYGKEIETLEWLIGLPKTIREQGDQAKQLLETVDEKPH